MLRDPARLKSLLLHPERPIQLVIAGKSHPADDGGKRLIQQLVQFADDPEVRHRIVFLPNYDIAMAQPLYPGCDVWLNNPLRPYEACGTSGMKAALNGGLNLSILDGWWDEWFDGQNGWAIPSADGVEDPDRRDDLEADGALRPDRERGRPALLRRRRGRRARSLAGDGAPHAALARAQGAGHPDGPRLRPHSSTPPPPATPAALNSDYAGRRRPRGLEVAGPRPAGTACASSTSRARASATPPRSAPSSPCAPSSPSARSRRTTSGCSWSTAAPPATTRSPTPSATPLTLAESYDGGRARFDGSVELARGGAFGYTVRVVPANALLASPAELGVVALPA